MIVAKFGGSSLADAAHFYMVKDILALEPRRRYVVVSAPGKRSDTDQKITDLLLTCHNKAQRGASFDAEFALVTERYQDIARELEIDDHIIDSELMEVKSALQTGASISYVASRGEYLCAKLFAKWMNLPFVDAKDIVRFDSLGKLNLAATLRLIKEALKKHRQAVIPGFYGADEEGNICTFTRGGSDVSGALVAAAMDADLYENWTDVTGFRSADPRIIEDASYISSLTYRELRELSYMGASVMHEEAVFPVRNAGIPTSIRNTANPHHPAP